MEAVPLTPSQTNVALFSFIVFWGCLDKMIATQTKCLYSEGVLDFWQAKVLYIHTVSECFLCDWFVIIGEVVQFVGTCNVNCFGHIKLKRPQTKEDEKERSNRQTTETRQEDIDLVGHRKSIWTWAVNVQDSLSVVFLCVCTTFIPIVRGKLARSCLMVIFKVYKVWNN